jgi:general secretion pathway protein G
MHARTRNAFTLVEILIVVVILGILAAVVVPTFANVIEPSRNATFATNLRAFAQGAQFYRAEESSWPPDGDSGVVPEGLEDLLDAASFERVTPIGGVWDTESDPGGLGYGIGVHFNGTGETRDGVYMTQIDDLIDDGDLASGGFQQFGGDRYYFILQGE